MESRCYIVLVIALCLVSAMPASGQITITSSDVNSFLAPGTLITTRVDTGHHTVNIGALGSTSWDFSALATNFSLTSKYVLPDTTPFFSIYPNATHCIWSGAGYTYMELAADLRFLGVAQAPPAMIRTKDIPYQIIEKLPLTFGTSWVATYSESSYVTIGGTTYMNVNHHVDSYSVDAYGDLTIPGGSVHPAVRLKTDRHITVGVNTIRNISYQFLAKDGASATVVPIDTNQAETGMVNVSTVTWNVTGVTSVEEIPGSGVPSKFALEQNYPNPFNPSTTIEFAVPEAALVQLEVINLLGEKVADLVNQELAPGRYSVRWDASAASSGVYFYRLRSGGFSEAKSLLLVR